MALGVPEFRRALLKLSGALDTDIAKLILALAAQDPAAALAIITEAYPDLASRYLAAVGDLTATWYEDQPPMPGSREFAAQPAELPPIEQLAANGRWSLTQPSPTSALQGSGRRRLFKMHRDTVAQNARREGVRWAREARPGACGFCRMLATRTLTEGSGGAPGLYSSEQSASANPHTTDTEGHDFCRCIAVPLRGGSEYKPPAYVHVWLADYDAVSEDDSGRLLSPARIAALMEARARDRGEAVGEHEDLPAVVDLDSAAKAPVAPTPPDPRDLPAPAREPLALPPALVDPPVELVVPDPDPVADVRADDHEGESAADRAIRELEEAIDSGDEARISAALERADQAEQAERKAQERSEKSAARRSAAARADQERIMELIEGGDDPQSAEAEVLSTNADGRRRVKKLVDDGLYDERSAQTVVFGHILERIRRRDFMAQARADGHTGKGFDDLLDSVFRDRVEELSAAAESATRGHMVKRKGSKFYNDTTQLWYCNDATARKYMSDELAAWFDENGRLTRSALRQMILDGSINSRASSGGGEDYLQ